MLSKRLLNTNKTSLALSIAYALSLTAFVSTNVSAEDAYVDTSNASHVINQNSQRMALISSQIKLLELEAELLERQSRVNSISGMSENVTDSSSRSSSELRFIPSIVSIEGSGSNLTAVLNMGEGKLLTVKTGDKITDNWKVDNINVRAITISGNGEKININASGNPTPIRSE